MKTAKKWDPNVTYQVGDVVLIDNKKFTIGPTGRPPLGKRPSENPSVASRLAALAALKENRGAVYGDEYKRFGRLMMAIFPAGLHLETEEEFNRYGMYVFIAAKLSRYGANMKRGGHSDSLDDLSVYAQMMRECDEEFKK